jgi:hypothetical protein
MTMNTQRTLYSPEGSPEVTWCSECRYFSGDCKCASPAQIVRLPVHQFVTVVMAPCVRRGSPIANSRLARP